MHPPPPLGRRAGRSALLRRDRCRRFGGLHPGRAELELGDLAERVDLVDGQQVGRCFIPFHFREAAANLLTIDEIDPFGKIPEFKFCAVRVEPL